MEMGQNQMTVEVHQTQRKVEDMTGHNGKADKKHLPEVGTYEVQEHAIEMNFSLPFELSCVLSQQQVSL